MAFSNFLTEKMHVLSVFRILMAFSDCKVQGRFKVLTFFEGRRVDQIRPSFSRKKCAKMLGFEN